MAVNDMPFQNLSKEDLKSDNLGKSNYMYIKHPHKWN